MDFSYENNELQLNKYIQECRNKIKTMFFSEEELNNGISIKNELIKDGRISINSSVSDALRKNRNNMIDIKLNHTMRVVSDVSNMANKMGTNIDFEKVLKVSALLHDIARFEQATYSDSFFDKECKKFEGMYHAEYGYKMLYINKKFKDFNIPKNYHYAISQVVKFHQEANLTGYLGSKFNNVNELNVNNLTGSENLNESEKIIVATLVQMVKDVDMLDILYQHLTGEFPVYRHSISYKNFDNTLDEISNYWGISKKEIMDYNELQSEDISNMKNINIPLDNVDPKKLTVPKDIQNKYFNNEDINLKEIMARQDWTFITGMWWRLNHFLNNINFVSNLEVVEEKKLLEAIYNTYPDKYKPLVFSAFEFAKEELLEKAIKQNKGEIYKTR